MYKSGIKKCLGVTHHDQNDPNQNFGNAMIKCSALGARLLAPKSCDDIDTLMNQVENYFGKINQKYFIGLHGIKEPENEVYRNWRNDWMFES